MQLQWILWASFIFLTQIRANRFNVSYADLQFCKEYDVKSGYKYSTFFHLESLKPSRNATENVDAIVNLKLFVLATKDAHILLSPTDQIKSSPIYEIVLGAGGNTFNEIRRQRQKDPLKTIKVRRFLSPTDVMPLTIRVLRSGNISVAITGQSPFITAYDPDVLEIKYISFSTWGDAEGKWFYDCENDSVGTKLAPIKPKLSKSQRLQNDLLQERNYNPTVAPFDLTTVLFDFDLANANFNAKKSFMKSHGRFRANWIDTQLVWNASEYGGKSWIHFESVGMHQLVWTPQIHLLNGKDDDFTWLSLVYAVTVYANGSVWAESTETTFSTWCLNSNRNWPHESIKCDIQIQLEHFTDAALAPLNQTFQIVPRHPKSYDYDEGEWHVIETITTSIPLSRVDTPYSVTNEQTLKNASILNINVILQRNFLFYNQLISVPLIGAYLLILLSFWVERFLRLTLNAISLIVLTVMLLIFADHGPNTYTPTIVIYYVCSLFITWISLLTFTVRCWFKEQKPNNELLTQIASSSFAQLLLGTDIVDSYEYREIEVEAINDFSKVIDRLLFFICLTLFLICIAVGY